MSTTTTRDEATITASSEATSTQTRSTTAGGTQSVESTASATTFHHKNRYGSYSTHNQPIYTGPVYHIEKAQFTGTPSPSLSPPPSLAASASGGPQHANPPGPSSPGITSSSSLSSTLAGRWVYVPEGEKQVTPQRPEKSRAGEVEEVNYPKDVVETSRDFEEELKIAFMGFLSKDHRPWKPPQRSGDGSA